MNAHTFSADLTAARPVYPDWRDRPGVAVLLDAIRDNPPTAHTLSKGYATTRDEWTAYTGPKVSALRTLYEAERHRCMLEADNANRGPWEALRMCDPMHRDGPRSVPSYLWLSSEVDRIIYEAIQGGAL